MRISLIFLLKNLESLPLLLQRTVRRSQILEMLYHYNPKNKALWKTGAQVSSKFWECYVWVLFKRQHTPLEMRLNTKYLEQTQYLYYTYAELRELRIDSIQTS